MPWFWGLKQDDEDSSSYEEYTDDEEVDDNEEDAGGDDEDDDEDDVDDGEELDEEDEEASSQHALETLNAEGAATAANRDKNDSIRGGSPNFNGRRGVVEEHDPEEDELVAVVAADSGGCGFGARGMANGKRSTNDRSEAAVDRGEHQSLDDDTSGCGSAAEIDEKLLKGVIPEAVEVDRDLGKRERGIASSSRIRADSALSYGSGVELDDHDRQELQNGHDVDDPIDPPSNLSSKDSSVSMADGPDDDDEEVTSKAEKQSLLALAAEHDRVDILQAILSEESADREELLRQGVPPLHIAVSFGSVNATNFLLRRGADPSIRPNVPAIRDAQKRQSKDQAAPVDIPNMSRFDDASAWELVFGIDTSSNEPSKAGWSMFGGGSSSNLDKSDNSARRRKTIQALANIAPSKREGIRHAFTAEALRCIGSDEVDRLKQLVDAGMPATIDIGGKTLLEWCVEMGAQKCKGLLQGPADEVLSFEPEPGSDGVVPKGASVEKRGSRIIDRGEPESVTQLSNRLDELESLSSALSVSLDGLAEEVSVCNGLLMMGGGAAALASHVRSLKATKDAKSAELERMQEAWENAEDELAYWVREGGPDAATIAQQVMTSPVGNFRRQSSLRVSSTLDDAEAQQRQLKAQVAASEQKIRKLRASIADLSEVCSRDLVEVERRGLSGGVTLVRGLREELREIDFQLSEAKNGDATCRTKIRMIQNKIHAARKPTPASSMNGRNETVTSGPDELITGDPHKTILVDTTKTSPTSESHSQNASLMTIAASNGEVAILSSNGEVTESDRILTGQSTAIAVLHSGTQGFFPLSLWQILLRIIGFGDDRPSRSSGAESQVFLI
jgi:hypothetical protein